MGRLSKLIDPPIIDYMMLFSYTSRITYYHASSTFHRNHKKEDTTLLATLNRHIISKHTVLVPQLSQLRSWGS